MNFSRRAVIAGVSAAMAASALPRIARAAGDLHVAFVPEVATTPDSISAKQPFVDYLSKATGMNVKLIIPTNYAATIVALGNGSVDLAHFGGLSYLIAHQRYGAEPQVQRAEDRQFHSLFITNSPKVQQLTDLKGETFAFGDVNSTSGHLIPAKEMIAVGIDPTKDINARFSGNHTNTALAVNSGQVVAGALDESVYKQMVSTKAIDPAKARVFKTSEPFIDYVWATNKTLSPSEAANIKLAFLTLKDPAVLQVLRATIYVAAADSEYESLRQTAIALKLLQ